MILKLITEIDITFIKDSFSYFSTVIDKKWLKKEIYKFKIAILTDINVILSF